MINSHTIQYPFDRTDLKMRADYDSGTEVVYLGYARPGGATSAAEWQIRKFTYDASDNPTQCDFASGTHDYDKVWDDRATYVYS
ncbi:MAG: hypothetical protein ABIL06_13330 [Pseudomonadota bacterium]|uniref:Uncharacterized protein n=1 Tax=viral metagenome TaxID=1070528 RepID=A0A6M3XAK8_9ZZZZ